MLLGTEDGGWREQNFLWPWSSIYSPTGQQVTIPKEQAQVFAGGIRSISSLFSQKSYTAGQRSHTLRSQQKKLAPSSCLGAVLLHSLGWAPSAELFLQLLMLVAATRGITAAAFFLCLFFTELINWIFCSAYWLALLERLHWCITLNVWCLPQIPWIPLITLLQEYKRPLFSSNVQTPPPKLLQFSSFENISKYRKISK